MLNRPAQILIALAVLLPAGCCRTPCCPPPPGGPATRGDTATRVDAPPQAEPLPTPEPSPWVTLFDGKTLDGWVTKGGRYDGNASWQVEEGTITGREGENHAGGLLYTAGTYGDFEVELEVFITYPFDSGIFLRMRPDAKGAQVTLDYRPDGEVGGIYSDGWWSHNPDAKAAFERDAWNHFRVRCEGKPMRVQVWMNGNAITDYTFPEDAEGFAEDGLIGLQVHGSRNDPPDSRVRFRNIRVRALSAGATN